jgi:predicted phosphodiesterase
MLKIHIFSDLHLDIGRSDLPHPVPGADVAVCAGDTCEGIDNAFCALRAAIPHPTPIVMVAGNHEFYRSCLPEELDTGRRHAPEFGIAFLENDTFTFPGVRVIGATLWTDYLLDGEPHRPLAMRNALNGLNDHRFIKWSKQPWLRFRPQEALQLHEASRAYIAQVLATPFDGSTIVVTHHAPTRWSIAPKYAKDLLTPAFASDLTGLIAQFQPDLWIHGHTHNSSDYWLGRTRVICNPHGYGTENRGFDPALVVEVGP